MLLPLLRDWVLLEDELCVVVVDSVAVALGSVRLTVLESDEPVVVVVLEDWLSRVVRVVWAEADVAAISAHAAKRTILIRASI